SPSVTTQYWVRISDGICSADSNPVTVTVCIPTVTTQPVNRTIAAGQSASLTVAVDIPGVTYQWYIGTSGVMTTPVSGATSAGLTVTPSSTTTYWCRISSSCTAANSNAATVTVCTPPFVSQYASTWSIAFGQSVNLFVNASGTNLTFQWYAGTT